MAGLRKPKKKSDSTSPNTILVVFLIIFGLLTVGVGGWTYSIFSQQKQLEDKLAEAKKALEPLDQHKQYYEFWAIEFLKHYGNDVEAKKGEFEATTIDYHRVNRDDYLPKDPAVPSPYAAKEKSYKVFKDFLDETIKPLEDLKAQGYKAVSYKDVIGELQANLKAAEAKLQTALAEKAAAHTKIDTYIAENQAEWTKFKVGLDQKHALVLDAARAKNDAHLKALAKIAELEAERQKEDQKARDEIAKKEDIIKVLQNELKTAKDTTAAPIPVATQKATGGVPHALMLDVSRGRSLWDSPVGKISRVVDDNQVYINIGSAAGVQKQMTFNIFAVGWKSKVESWRDQAVGRLKGTLEVIRVVDANSSLARITSLYDAEGRELAINDPNLGRVRREVEHPLKEGDLLFNLAIGLHVAIAGNINWEDGVLSNDPAEQMRTLRAFIRTLEKQGVIVDSYLDLTEGKLVGQVKPQTRLLISGAMLRNPDGMNEHAKKVNEVIGAIRNQAIELGMFQISADNLAFVIGYRQARSANDYSLSGFRPGLPTAPGQ